MWQTRVCATRTWTATSSARPASLCDPASLQQPTNQTIQPSHQPKLTICCGLQYVAVVPSDAKDPFYTNWTKEGPLMNGLVNPIVNSTGDDPSTAWQNPAKTGASSKGRLGLVLPRL